MTLVNMRKTLVACVLGFTLMFVVAFPSTAFAVTSAEKQAEAQAVLASLNAMQAQLDQASNDSYLAQQAQAEAQAQADAAQAKIEEATNEILSLQDRLGARATAMYRDGNTSFLDLILGATTFEEFSNGWDLLTSINESDTELINTTKALRAEVEEQKAIYDEQNRIATEKAAEAARIEAEAQATVAVMQDTYNNLSEEVAILLEQERAAQEAAQAARVDQVLAAAAASAAQSQDYGAMTATGDGTYTIADNGTPMTGGSANVAYDANTGNAVVDRAYANLGAAYSYGACSPDAFDCSGFVSYALTGDYNRLGSTTTFMQNYTQVTDPQPGDIAVNAGHCGIYVGDGNMVHAATYGVGVVEGPVQDGMIFVRPNY